MKNNYSYKNIWKIALPIILGSFAQDLITISDTIFVGRLGEIELGAIAIAGIFYLSIIMLGLGFGLGLQVILARRFGEKNYEKLQQVWVQSLFLLFGFSLIIFIVLKVFSPLLLHHIISSEEICLKAIGFLKIRYWGLFAAFLNIGFRSFFIGISNTRAISNTTILMAIINILFNYLLIFGIGAFPALGLNGAAYASVIAEYSALIAFAIIVFSSKTFKQYCCNSRIALKINEFRLILRISIPSMAQNFFSFGSWFVFFVIVEKMGTQELAISNIIRSIYIVLLLPILGFASTTNTLTSYSIGNKESNKISSIIKKSMTLCITIIGLIISICSVFPRTIIRLFTNNQTLIELTVPVFYVVAVSALFIAFGFILLNAVTGTGRTNVSLTIEVFSITLYLIGVKLISINSLQIQHAWSMELAYGLIIGLLSIIYLKKGNWRKGSV